MARACTASRNPASVGVTPRAERRNSAAPIASSSLRICAVTAGCDRWRVLAAAEIRPASSTVRKVGRGRGSSASELMAISVADDVSPSTSAATDDIRPCSPHERRDFHADPPALGAPRRARGRAARGRPHAPSVASAACLLAGIAVSFTLGNPWPARTRPLAQKALTWSVMGLGAGMNLAVIGGSTRMVRLHRDRHHDGVRARHLPRPAPPGRPRHLAPHHRRHRDLRR